MAVENENYKLEILEYAVNQSINRLLPDSSKDALSVILYRNNEVVWKVATDIYTKSGHQIDFLLVKNILNLRIEPLRNKIAEEERIKAELEIQKRMREAEETRIKKEQETEKARIREKLKAKRLAREVEEAKVKAKLEAKRLAKIAEREKIEKERKKKQQKQLQQFKEANPKININDYEKLESFLEVFERVKNVIVDRLEVNNEEINKEVIKLDAVLTTDLGVEDQNHGSFGHFERLELAMGIEDEFDIEISCQEEETILTLSIGQLVNLVLQKI